MTQGQRAQAGVCEAGQLAVPGLEALREIHAGRSPQPSIHRWSGRKLTALQHGEASIAMPASGWFCGPKGRLHSGIFAFLLDMAHLYAVVSTLPAGGGLTVAWRRWVSPDVGVRWLLDWLFRGGAPADRTAKTVE
jgi:hypothetical protein